MVIVNAVDSVRASHSRILSDASGDGPSAKRTGGCREGQGRTLRMLAWRTEAFEPGDNIDGQRGMAPAVSWAEVWDKSA